jgi:glycine cleavage system H protein
MAYPDSFKYTKDHEWVSVEGGVGTVGITDHAQQALGDVVFVDLPATGTKVKLGEQFGTIESVKAVSELFAPVSGEIVAVNAALQDQPDLVNRDPHAGAWMVKVKLSDPQEVAGLLDSAAYAALL